MRLCFVFVLIFFAAASHAATLTLDPAQSHITLAGNVAGFKLAEQAPGSLSTTLGGTITVSNFNGQIQITGAALDANTNGVWAPGRNGQPTSPADLAGKASTLFGDITGALRDLVVNASSSPKPLSTDGQFDASSIVFEFPAHSTSALEYDSFVTGKGTNYLAGAGTNQTATVGTFVETNGVQTLTIKLNATFYFTLALPNDTALTLTGDIVAINGSGSTKPTITGIEIDNGQAKLTASQTSATTHVESSTTLTGWAPEDATVTTADASTRTFTVPVNAPYRFFRLVD